MWLFQQTKHYFVTRGLGKLTGVGKNVGAADLEENI